MPRGRKSVVVDEKVLREIISDIEGKEQFNKQSTLFSRVATEYEAKFQVKITPSIVYLRVKQFNIPLKTPKGKRGGNVSGEELKARFAKAKENGGELDIKPTAKQTVEQLLLYAEPKERAKYDALAKSVLRGSRKAAIKLNCLACANFQSTEVRNCQVDTCPLWLFRPYK